MLCSKASSLKSDFSSRPVRHPKVIVAAFHFERAHITYDIYILYCCSIHTIKHAFAKRKIYIHDTFFMDVPCVDLTWLPEPGSCSELEKDSGAAGTFGKGRIVK